MSTHKRILVLGSASWLGSILLAKLNLENFKVSATYYNTCLNFGNEIHHVEAKKLKDYKSILKAQEPEIIINFLRGENEEGLKIHQEIKHYCESNPGSHYIYCSSALALDAHKNTSLTEDVLAKATSDYGSFKADCERMLYDSTMDWTILRFSSLQGYCQHKKIRNEHFLSQLKQGEVIKVDEQVIQNRMFVEDAVDLILRIIDEKHTEIIHFGTTDASDEIDFLRKQAQCFGYNPEQVVSSGKLRNVNLNCIPNKIHRINEASLNFTENDTLQKIQHIPTYQKYMITNEV